MKNFNSTKLSIFDRLNHILLKENKKQYYIKIVFRLFSYVCLYLEKIHAESIYVVYKNNKKYYYSSKLNFYDVLELYSNLELADSTKVFYTNILKKYFKILNNDDKITLKASFNSYKEKKYFI